jgi:ubiquinone/menaquinone biosynthesis C-methylase UbiE
MERPAKPLLAKWQAPLEILAFLLRIISKFIIQFLTRFTMERNPITFDGSIPKNYDHYFGPFLFDPYAADLVSRIEITPGSNILELACGTGIVTRRLAGQLPASAELTVTDINADMLSVAQDKISAPNVCWDTVDMVALPYEHDLFDTVVCQFGLMFAMDKYKAVTEMHRVLKRGGKLLFNVWANIADNPVWRINNTLIARFFPNAPLNPAFGPFSMSDENSGLSLLQQAGFTRYKVESVIKTGICDTASDAANGFALGSPLYNLMKNDPSLVERFRDALEEAIASELGNNPVRSPLHSLVFSAEK